MPQNHNMYPSGLTVNGCFFPVFVLERSGFSSSVKIKQGGIYIFLSKFEKGSSGQILVNKFLVWAKDKLSQIQLTDFVPPSYTHGSAVVTHNKIYQLNLRCDGGEGVKFNLLGHNLIDISYNNLLTGKLLYDEIRNCVKSVLIQDQSSYLHTTIQDLNFLHFNEQINKVRFKAVSSRFGSCSIKRNINIAYCLLFAPRRVFEYVCVHELSHLKHFNHSPDFWELVRSVLPDYKDSRKWLNTNGLLLR